MVAIVSGMYRNGHVELLEIPTGITEGRVRVVMSDDRSSIQEEQRLLFGKYSGARQSSLNDFADAEWNDQREGLHGS